MSDGVLRRASFPGIEGGKATVVADPSAAAERALIQRIGAGEEEAFRRLFRAFAPTALSLARRVVRQSYLAEEIVQEVFLAVWRKPEAYDPDRGSVRSWLMGMVHHRAVDVVRREESQRRRAEAALPEADPGDDPGVTVVEELGIPAERRAVRLALEDIPAEQRQVLEMMYFDGKSQSQIAERLGMPLGTVKSRTLLGMRRLRTLLVGTGR
jgi:RNA polymerase sigma factor (sigma-70 family)